MSERKSLELRVSVDVGYCRHSVAIGLPDGQVLEEFEITHRPVELPGIERGDGDLRLYDHHLGIDAFSLKEAPFRSVVGRQRRKADGARSNPDIFEFLGSCCRDITHY